MHNPPTRNLSEAAGCEIEKCARCGKCRSVCPVFDAVKDEAFVARGRIALTDALAKGEIPSSGEVAAIMSACLMCRRCSEICPSGVEFMEVLKAARARLAQDRGVPAALSFFFRHVLPRRRIFDAVIQCASVGQRLIPGKRSGMLRHLPLLVKGGKWLPPLAKISALSAYSGSTKAEGAKMRVGIFVGCLINYVYPHLIGDALEVLRRAGIEAVVPASQVCCGTPVLALGDIENARMLARKNRDCFRGIDCEYIITLCASCGRTLKQDYGELLEDAGLPLGAPVLDVSEFLCKHAELEISLREVPVTYHDPCHLRWGQQITTEPRKLLSRSRLFEEQPGEMNCCGQGGAFHVLFPDIAEKIARKKMDSLASVQAREVATGCPGCMMQLNDLFARSGSDRKAVHVIEVLAHRE